MENIEEHKSKEETFRTDNKKINETFQTAHIKQKIKKVKKRKVKRNFKNIEEFDTLDNNDNEEEKEEDKEEEKIEVEDKKPITISTFVNTFFDSFYKALFKEKMKEGVKFERDDYEGYDTVKEGARSAFDPRAWLIMFIESLYAKASWLANFISTTLLTVMVKNKYTTNDLAVTRENIVWILSVIVASFAVFNWYYILFYAKDQGIPLFKITRDMLWKATVPSDNPNDSDVLPMFAKFAFWLFEFALAFFEYFNDFVILLFPKVLSFFFDGRACFVITFVLLIFAFKEFAVAFKDFMIGLLSNVQDNRMINIMYGLLVIMFIISVTSLRFTGDIQADIQYGMDYIGSFLNPIVAIIKLIIRFMIIMVISVPMGGVAIGILFLYYSFFGIAHYEEDGFAAVPQVMQDIVEHAKQKDSLYGRTKYCRSNGFYRFILFIITILKVLFQAAFVFATPLALAILFYIGGGKSYEFLSSTQTMLGKQPLNIAMAILFIIAGVISTLMVAFNIFDQKTLIMSGFLKKVVPSIFSDPEEEIEEPDYKYPDAYKAYVRDQKSAGSLIESFNKIYASEIEEEDTETNQENEE